MELPLCRNFVRKLGCAESKVILIEENDEAWSFGCKTCGCVQLVSKEGVRDKTKFELAAKRTEEETERLRRWNARPKIFS